MRVLIRASLTALTAVTALAALPATARAQDSPGAVRPGMGEADVRAAWGEPLAIRRINNWMYMFYENGMERETRYHDVVFLQNGQVVDAIVRMPGRVYAGQSSSPPERLPEFSAPRRPDGGGTGPTN